MVSNDIIHYIIYLIVSLIFNSGCGVVTYICRFVENFGPELLNENKISPGKTRYIQNQHVQLFLAGLFIFRSVLWCYSVVLPSLVDCRL